MLPYTIGDRSITVCISGGIPRTIDSSHANFLSVKEAIKRNAWDKVEKLVDMASAIRLYGAGDIEVRDGEVLYKGEKVSGTVVDRILTMMNEGYDFQFMALFLNNLMQNPSRVAVQELYLFLEANGLTITEKGNFIAYKGVRNDFKDKYSGTIDNSPGKLVKMPRNAVDDVRDRTCSYGLHFGALSYARNWGPTVVLVEINPKDVVSIPSDHNNQKGRCCEYRVLRVLGDTQNGVKSSVYRDADAA